MSTATQTDAQRNTPGHFASPDKLVDLPRLLTAFYANHLDPAKIKRESWY
jgi:phosphoglucomutase